MYLLIDSGLPVRLELLAILLTLLISPLDGMTVNYPREYGVEGYIGVSVEQTYS